MAGVDGAEHRVKTGGHGFTPRSKVGASYLAPRDHQIVSRYPIFHLPDSHLRTALPLPGKFLQSIAARRGRHRHRGSATRERERADGLPALASASISRSRPQGQLPPPLSTPAVFHFSTSLLHEPLLGCNRLKGTFHPAGKVAVLRPLPGSVLLLLAALVAAQLASFTRFHSDADGAARRTAAAAPQRGRVPGATMPLVSCSAMRARPIWPRVRGALTRAQTHGLPTRGVTGWRTRTPAHLQRAQRRGPRRQVRPAAHRARGGNACARESTTPKTRAKSHPDALARALARTERTRARARE